MIYTTLNRISRLSNRKFDYSSLLKKLGKKKADDEPLSFAKIIKHGGLDYAITCCEAEPQYAKTWLLFYEWLTKQQNDEPHTIVSTDSWSIWCTIAESSARTIADRKCDNLSGRISDSQFSIVWSNAYDTARSAQTAKFLELVRAA